MRQVRFDADQAAREYGLKKPSQFVEVTWFKNDDAGDDKRRTAMDALRTWRREVLPSLTPGIIVWNNPIGGGRGNQRERIYQLAGFGSYDESMDGQYGVVVQDEMETT